MISKNLLGATGRRLFKRNSSNSSANSEVLPPPAKKQKKDKKKKKSSSSDSSDSSKDWILRTFGKKHEEKTKQSKKDKKRDKKDKAHDKKSKKTRASGQSSTSQFNFDLNPLPTFDEADEGSITEEDKQNLLRVLDIQLKPEEENSEDWSTHATIKASQEKLRTLAERNSVSTTGTKKQLMERILEKLSECGSSKKKE